MQLDCEYPSTFTADHHISEGRVSADVTSVCEMQQKKTTTFASEQPSIAQIPRFSASFALYHSEEGCRHRSKLQLPNEYLGKISVLSIPMTG